MYCPKCSQQQASADVRFCSRCGFQLGVVKELLAQSDAIAPGAAETPPPAEARGLRKRDVTIGALLMFIISLVVVTLPPHVPPPVRNEQIVITVGLFLALALFINFITPLLKLVGKLFAEDDAPSRKNKLPAPDLVTKVGPNANRPALPPQSAHAAEFHPPRVDTAEMLRPPSVTERTTNLLNNQ